MSQKEREKGVGEGRQLLDRQERDQDIGEGKAGGGGMLKLRPYFSNVPVQRQRVRNPEYEHDDDGSPISEQPQHWQPWQRRKHRCHDVRNGVADNDAERHHASECTFSGRDFASSQQPAISSSSSSSHTLLRQQKKEMVKKEIMK